MLGGTVVVNPGPMKDGFYAEAVLDGTKLTVRLRKINVP
jgi:Icc-related predicted phosphoesterase